MGTLTPGSMAGALRGAGVAAVAEGVSVCRMAVPAAFSDLLEISSQVESAIVLDGEKVVASSLSQAQRSHELAEAVRRVVQSAERTRAGVKQIEVVLQEGHLFVVCEGGHLIAAVTGPGPPSGLVFYDLRACVSGLAAAKSQSDAKK